MERYYSSLSPDSSLTNSHHHHTTSNTSSIAAHAETATTSPSPPSFQKSLHSVRKTQAKPWKKPTAPLPPSAATRVYKVEPINFRDLVQKLTGAASCLQSRRLQESAPPPLGLIAPTPVRVSNNAAAAPGAMARQRAAPMMEKVEAGRSSPQSAVYKEMMGETLETKGHKFGDGFELSLSPSLHAWGSIPLLSPGTLSGF